MGNNQSCPDMSLYTKTSDIQTCPDMSLYTKTSDIQTGPDMSLYMKKSQCQVTVEDEVKLEASLNMAEPVAYIKAGKLELNCSANYPKLEYDHGDHKLDWMTINKLDECLKADHCVIQEGGITISQLIDLK